MSKCDKNRIQSHKSVNLYDFIDRFCHKLNLNNEDIIHIKEISKICDKLSLINDNTPPAMASGCIYLYIRYMKIDIPKKEISNICNLNYINNTSFLLIVFGLYLALQMFVGITLKKQNYFFVF